MEMMLELFPGIVLMKYIKMTENNQMSPLIYDKELHAR